MTTTQSLFSPHHFIDDGDIALDYLDHDVADVLAHIYVHGCAVVAVAVHGDGGVNCLQQRFLVNAGEYEAGVVKALRALSAGADADGRERMSNRCEET